MIKPASSSTPNKIAENYRLFPYFKTACFHISRWATLCRTDLHICTPYFKVNHALYIFVQHKRLTISTCLCQDCVGATDDTHVITKVPRSQALAYTGESTTPARIC
jgi:hypothetical protein